jgi:hypothetical protein
MICLTFGDFSALLVLALMAFMDVDHILALFVNCLFYFATLKCLIVLLMLCRKRKPRNNITKAWFPIKNITKDMVGEVSVFSTPVNNRIYKIAFLVPS